MIMESSAVAALLYDALHSDLALFIPVVYCRIMLGDERFFLRVPLAVAFGLLALALFSWQGHGDWAAFNTMMVTLGVSLLRPYHLSTVGQAFSSQQRVLLLSVGIGLIAAVGRPLACYLLPIEELALAYSTARLFAASALEPAAARLALISVTSQLPLGILTITNLRASQKRKNALITIGKAAPASAGTGKEDAGAGRASQLSARGFSRMVLGFIAFTAIPYFLQRSVIESINARAMVRFVDEVENSMRLGAVLRSGASLSAAAAEQTVDSQAQHLRQVLTTSYQLLERKLFTLPRLALLPGAMLGHPWASLAGMGVAVAFDAAKAKAVAAITLKIESLNRESRRLSSIRSRVEAHDSQHAALLRGARAEAFTREHWRAVTEELQAVNGRTRALEGLRLWIRWLFWQDVVLPGVECWIAFLLEQGHIEVAEVLVYARAFDDAIDAVLMRSKAEAELARLTSDAHRLASLHAALGTAAQPPPGTPPLSAALSATGGSAASGSGAGSALGLQGIAYRRGAASVRIEQVELPVPGFYAVAGPNGVGKSSLFALIGAAHQALQEAGPGGNAGAGEGEAAVVELPPGLNITRGPGRVTLPPGPDGKCPHLVEVGQRGYTPLHMRPIDWLTSEQAAAGTAVDLAAAADRIAELAAELRLGLGEARSSEASGDAEACVAPRAAEDEGPARLDAADPTASPPPTASECPAEPVFVSSLLREHEDWGGAMSGGQRVKVELMRSVLLRDSCPGVLLLDEALAPLDGWSKLHLMRRLRSFCTHSLVLVIYHPDAREPGAGEAEAGDEDAAVSSAAVDDGSGAAKASRAGTRTALADVCGAGGGSFFDGVVQFGGDGTVTFDAVLDRCP